MIVNEPSARASLRAAFQRYEKALTSNDLAVLDELFLDATQTIRYGITENLYGIEEIRAFRAGRPATSLERQLERTEITTYGDSFGIASTLFRRASAPGRIGRQMQTWIRTLDPLIKSQLLYQLSYAPAGAGVTGLLARRQGVGRLAGFAIRHCQAARLRLIKKLRRGRSSEVERQLPKLNVVGSIPIARSSSFSG